MHLVKIEIIKNLNLLISQGEHRLICIESNYMALIGLEYILKDWPVDKKE